MPMNAATTTQPTQDIAKDPEVNAFTKLLNQPLSSTRFEPRDRDEALEDARRAAKIRLYNIQSEDDGWARITHGAALGLPSGAAMAGIALIYQKSTQSYVPCMSAKLKLALMLSRRDLVEYFRLVELTDKSATWVAKRRDDAKEQSYTFTWADATQAGLVGRGRDGGESNNYDRHPKPMLQWRACGRLADIVGADILWGIATREDIEDNEQLTEAEQRLLRERPTEPPIEAVKSRDWPGEVETLKTAIEDAATSGKATHKRAVRDLFAKFETEAPPGFVDDVKAFYVWVTSGKRGPKPTTGVPQVQASLSVATTQPQRPDPKLHPYLPPNQRGEDYQGPDEPFG
jgi:hypothetical protein